TCALPIFCFECGEDLAGWPDEAPDGGRVVRDRAQIHLEAIWASRQRLPPHAPVFRATHRTHPQRFRANRPLVRRPRRPAVRATLRTVFSASGPARRGAM